MVLSAIESTETVCVLLDSRARTAPCNVIPITLVKTARCSVIASTMLCVTMSMGHVRAQLDGWAHGVIRLVLKVFTVMAAYLLVTASTVSVIMSLELVSAILASWGSRVI